MTTLLKDAIAAKISRALDAAVAAGDLPPEARAEVQVERTRNPAHGDYASNVAMTLARPARRAPAQIAAAIAGRLECDGLLARVDVAAPGFLNVTLAEDALTARVREVLAGGAAYGRSQVGRGERIVLEYVSANPTGPLHVGHGRWAVLGSSLASLLRWAGFTVHEEFYVNDFGNQLQNLGKSLYYRVHGLPLPEGATDLYAGAYVEEAAEAARKTIPDLPGLSEAAQVERLADFGRDYFIAQQEAVLERLGANFDHWFSERDLHRSGEVAQALDLLKERGEIEEREGALWLLSSKYGDSEDRVVVRSDGRPTYLAADIAYHWDKLRRGHQRLINIWGADHHGYVARMKAAIAALGHDAASLEVLLGQLVKLFRGGEEVRMSKRAGNIVTIDEVVDEVGVDATRYFLVARSADTQIDFDLDLAVKESADNPVFYVQYAHARICSIWRMGQEQGLLPADLGAVDLAPLAHPDERKLMLDLAQFPDEVAAAAVAREPHRITRYAQELATDFHQFYTNCRVLNEAQPALTAARLALVAASRTVLANALSGILKISAPERM
ncbi:MAG: arginine--tRNA ligase [Candidatus Sericytochromatia bacterium]|nr:arginine--tRNA ligase [Candidatus Tanganyikabacteria bacterium]